MPAVPVARHGVSLVVLLANGGKVVDVDGRYGEVDAASKLPFVILRCDDMAVAFSAGVKGAFMALVAGVSVAIESARSNRDYSDGDFVRF